MDNQLFSGDHVLPDVSPNVGGGDLRHEGMLEHFIRSLELTENLANEIAITDAWPW